MDTIVPSANAVPHADGILKSMSTSVTEIIDSIEFNSPPAYALELSHLEQANPRGYTRPMFLFPRVKGMDQIEVVEIFEKALKPTLKAIPSLACEFVPVEDGKTPTGRVALKHGDFGSLVSRTFEAPVSHTRNCDNKSFLNHDLTLKYSAPAVSSLSREKISLLGFLN